MVSCSVDEEGLIGSFPYLDIYTKDTTITKAASTTYIKYKSNRPVTARVNTACSWMTATVDNNYIILSYNENTLEEKRSTIVEISTQNNLISHTINVRQDASGEVTFTGDLILKSKNEISQNTYTKVQGTLMVGNFSHIQTKSAATVNMDTDKYHLTVLPSDIDNDDIATLTEQIHHIEDQAVVIVNTKVSQFPFDLLKNNNVNTLHFDFNELSSLPSGEELGSLNLKKLTLRGNQISDISSLKECSALTHLDISENNIYEVNSILGNTELDYVNLSGLPLTKQQVEIFRENHKNTSVTAEQLRMEEALVPIIEKIEIEVLSDTRVKLTAKVSGNNAKINKAGFYIGEKKGLSNMTEFECTYSNGKFTKTYDVPTLTNQIYHVRAFADNSTGRGYSSAGYFGSLFTEEDVFITNKNDLYNFYLNNYSHVYGSVLIGNTAEPGNGVNGISLYENDYNLVFQESNELSDLSELASLVYIDNGLYVGNVKLQNADALTHIEGIKTLWLKGNELTNLPAMACDKSLETLNVSRNTVASLTFLDRMPNLTHLYVGDSNAPQEETNNIYDIESLQNYPNLKHIDLSGLPLHEWQVENLRAAMNEYDTEIIFEPGSRTPFIPTVSTLKAKSSSGSIMLRGQVTASGNNAATIEYGFYYGKDLENMTKVVVGETCVINEVFTHTLNIDDTDIYYFRAYAINQYGESWSEHKTFTMSWIDLSAEGTANCYIVPGEGRYAFDATVKGSSTESVGLPVSADLLWEMVTPDLSKNIITSVTFNDGQVEFEVNENGEYGNALIAVRDLYGDILWSWHIWICDFEPEETKQKYSEGIVMMDRNLGATYNQYTTSYDLFRRAEGLFYQWGRKDPFSSGLYTTRSSSFNYISELAKAPTEFVTVSTWISAGLNQMWKTDEKTINDPCPAGWVVPDEYFASSLQSTENTDYGGNLRYDGTNTTYYPASHYIDYWGNLGRSSYEGFYWTNRAVYDDSGRRVRTSWDISREDQNYNYGYTIRCAKFENFGIPTVETTRIMATKIDVLGKVDIRDFSNLSDRGFVWSQNDSNATIATGESVSAGSGNGTFTATITGLTAQTGYWIRPYVVGKDVTRYGEAIWVQTAKTGLGDQVTEDEYEW